VGVDGTGVDRDVVPAQEELESLRERVSQLEHALESRVVVEQAKGILAERFHLAVDDAFLVLRYAARSSRRDIHEVAREVVTSRVTPGSVTVALARQQRWRAVGQRERAEAHREKAHEELRRTDRILKQREGQLRPEGSG
jgi:hypothetical protein